ncbi:MAG TPA: peptidylprolyl isomerase [Vicinamibacteria bacterium]|nr:peptidylprolyl isomerase [Vicinamibacteria bacterium]
MIAAISMTVLFAAAAQSAAPASPRAPLSASPMVPDGLAGAGDGPLEALVETSEGPFVIKLLPEVAPKHVAHFVKTARKGGFDGTTFHRVIPRGIVQGGDPLSKDPAKKALYGTGGLGLLKAEFSDRPMKRASVAAVLRPSSPDSAGNQFFVVVTDQPALTGKYTVFGEVIGGMTVVDRISETPVVGDKPEKRIVIEKVTIRKTGTETTDPA